MTTPRLAFIGAGNMASAIIGGLVAKGYAPDSICAADPLQANLDRLQADYAIQTSSGNQAAIDGADVVVLAVKPQIMKSLADDIRPCLQQKQPLLISIAAGITVSSLANWLGDALPIVRCMPNTPALVQSGATALYANSAVSKQQKDWADDLMSAIGLVCWLDDEALLDAVTAVSGSGPAYFFLVMEAMIAAGEQLGLSREMAEQLTLQTALGAARMAQHSDVDVSELRKRVTSPNGTTAEALRVFEERGLKAIFSQALQAADQRSRELAEELGKA